MEGNGQLSLPDEDEDLEALRLAALQSLKKKTNNDLQTVDVFDGKEKPKHFSGSPRGKHKRGKFLRLQQGRQNRNGQFNGWSRNSNLIAVPMITENEKLSDNKITATDNAPKLILPQDRYCRLDKLQEKTDTLTSKFDRYDNSDESDEESEEEEEVEEKLNCGTDDKEKTELKRTDSLEELMAELENEIQGVSSKPVEEIKQIKPKQVKKKRKISINAPATTSSNPIVPTSPETTDNKAMNVLKENLKPEPKKVENKKPALHPRENFTNRQRKWQNKLRPPRQHFPPPPPNIHPPSMVPPIAEIIPPMVPFVPTPVQTFPPYNPPPPIPFDSGVYVPPMVFEAPPLSQLVPPQPPPVFDRPLSPLSINTDTYNLAGALGQLSPRSAAFVLENRKIIEKRKRRSWSRSPSPPRFRRSKSPKRVSLSPKRLSKSPKRRSLSPPSPVRKVLPPRGNSPNKKGSSVHDRLGIKPQLKTESPDDKANKEKVKPNKIEEKKEDVLDPVLEARRKKFERNEIRITEGVIRLKKPPPVNEETKENRAKDEETKSDDRKGGEEDEDVFDEDALLQDEDAEADPDDSLLLDHTTLFSDEETDSDNEGRFKTKQENQCSQKVAILPFTKLINGAKSEVKQSLPEEKRNRRSPAKKVAATKTSNKKSENKIKQPIGFSERKIEIKIRNPAKYERAKSSEKKVELTTKKEEENETERSKEGGEETQNANISEGDLRAQLSRKRAERQKHPLPDVVPSRLLQNALKGVGFRKGKKTKSKDEANEGKIPIHLRLGVANSGSEVFGKKSRKQKNKGSQEQV